MSESSFKSSLDTIRKGLSSYASRFKDKLDINSTKTLYLNFPSEEALRDVIGMSFVQTKCLVRWKAFLDEMATQRQRTVVFISAEGQYFAVYVFFIPYSHSHLFNKLKIHTTFMYAYTYPLSLVTHSLIQKLTQAIMHNYVMLEPQDG